MSCRASSAPRPVFLTLRHLFLFPQRKQAHDGDCTTVTKYLCKLSFRCPALDPEEMFHETPISVVLCMQQPSRDIDLREVRNYRSGMALGER